MHYRQCICKYFKEPARITILENIIIIHYTVNFLSKNCMSICAIWLLCVIFP